jgi:hypothetical protein
VNDASTGFSMSCHLQPSDILPQKTTWLLEGGKRNRYNMGPLQGRRGGGNQTTYNKFTQDA